ncbi:hypothetical protein MKZ38_007080 [Zalerion maritima]|uniref:Uncharacterized protein n=1 Tax=Zalerion maritima TaxID=339359 RepID=A0AAD5WQ03_9PEZI|nr:hypothetical protein MKZ38_007080 [Zalerion maritima]
MASLRSTAVLLLGIVPAISALPNGITEPPAIPTAIQRLLARDTDPPFLGYTEEGCSYSPVSCHTNSYFCGTEGSYGACCEVGPRKVGPQPPIACDGSTGVIYDFTTATVSTLCSESMTCGTQLLFSNKYEPGDATTFIRCLYQDELNETVIYRGLIPSEIFKYIRTWVYCFTPRDDCIEAGTYGWM